MQALHVTGPGPMGLAGLAAARLLHVPVSGACGGAQAAAMSATAWSPGAAARRRYLRWFYRRLDTVVAPSRDAARRLAAAGVAGARLRVAPAEPAAAARAPRARPTPR